MTEGRGVPTIMVADYVHDEHTVLGRFRHGGWEGGGDGVAHRIGGGEEPYRPPGFAAPVSLRRRPLEAECEAAFVAFARTARPQ